MHLYVFALNICNLGIFNGKHLYMGSARLRWSTRALDGQELKRTALESRWLRLQARNWCVLGSGLKRSKATNRSYPRNRIRSRRFHLLGKAESERPWSMRRSLEALLVQDYTGQVLNSKRRTSFPVARTGLAARQLYRSNQGEAVGYSEVLS